MTGRFDYADGATDEDSDPWVSADERTIYFVRDVGGGNTDIFRATR